MIVVRVVGVALGVALLAWAYEILDNIWNYNDSGTLTYVLFAAIPSLIGLLLIVVSLRRPERASRGE